MPKWAPNSNLLHCPTCSVPPAGLLDCDGGRLDLADAVVPQLDAPEVGLPGERPRVDLRDGVVVQVDVLQAGK